MFRPHHLHGTTSGQKLKKEVPEELATWLAVPSLGPKKIAMIWKTLGITTLPELEAAARAGKLRDMPGMGAKSESAILEGLASLGRRSARIPLGHAFPLAMEIIERLKKAFPPPKFGVQAWDYGQQVGVRRIGPSGRERSVALRNLRNPADLDRHVAELRALL